MSVVEPSIESTTVRRIIRAMVYVTAAALLAVVVHAGQSTDSSQTPFRVGTVLIPVDVSVLDSDRKPIRGLTAADFTVLENGQPRPVVIFSSVDVPLATPVRATGAESSLASWTRDIPRDVVVNDLPAEGRLVVILFDRSIPTGAPVQAAREIAMAAVDELGPGDVAAVVRSSGFASDGRVQGFTADRRLLVAAIESTFTGTTSTELNPSPIPGQDPSTADCHCGLCVFETIGNVAAAMAEAPRRRKVLLFVGSAITMPMAAATDRCYGVTREPRERLTRELEMANVTVHSIDPSGVIATSPRPAFVVPREQTLAQASRPPGDYAQADLLRLDNLRVLPNATGGRLVANTNAPAEHLPAIFEESQSYYLLGFEPAVPPDGGFHRIDVRVNRRGATVRARNGYTVTPLAAVPVHVAGSESGIPPDLLAALQGAQPRQQLRLSANVMPFPAATAQPVPVAVLLGTSLPPGDTRRIAVAVGAFDLRGQSVVVHAQTLEVSGLRPGDALDGLTTRLSLPPGRYEIRAAVRDERTRAVGSVFTFLDLPDGSAGAVTLSGIAFQSQARPPNPANPLADLVPFTPTVARTYTQKDHVDAFVRVQANAASRLVSIRIQIVDTGGTVRFEQTAPLGQDAFTATGAAHTVALPLAGLPPGEYLLRVVASTAEGRAQRDARFDVVP